MVQGIIKSKVSKNRSTSRNTPTNKTKKGARTIAPKKAVLVCHVLLSTKFSAGLTAMTERTLGSKVGHLELLHGGGKSEKETERLKGGTKKFG
ncbi:UPF0390 protein [Golovinomyces cichoracearum]|uniref:UPF0390 protein n=1 Tax=Golovinomyces cichoracearum TaxID=62708 RepID=A0A420ITW7_9PEZI|nr:UPF0390 protein [Golovinomyces cichoracearum]